MILGSDSHTRYGALAPWLSARAAASWQSSCWAAPMMLPPGCGGHLPDRQSAGGLRPPRCSHCPCGQAVQERLRQNKVMEFVGPGIASLRQDTRNAIDAMTTETTCLSSIWETDEVTQRFLAVHGRAADYKKLAPADLATMTAWWRWIFLPSVP